MMSARSGPAAPMRKVPQQQPMPGTRIPTLSEVFALVRKSGDSRCGSISKPKSIPTIPSSPRSAALRHPVAGFLQAEKFRTVSRFSLSIGARYNWCRNGRPRYLRSISPAKRPGPDRRAGQGFQVDGGFQSGRPWPLAAADDQGGRRGDLVALLRDIDAELDPKPIASASRWWSGPSTSRKIWRE